MDKASYRVTIQGNLGFSIRTKRSISTQFGTSDSKSRLCHVCRKAEQFPIKPLHQCTECKKQYHLSCVKSDEVFDESQHDTNWVCPRCCRAGKGYGNISQPPVSAQFKIHQAACVKCYKPLSTLPGKDKLCSSCGKKRFQVEIPENEAKRPKLLRIQSEQSRKPSGHRHGDRADFNIATSEHPNLKSISISSEREKKETMSSDDNKASGSTQLLTFNLERLLESHHMNEQMPYAKLPTPENGNQYTQKSEDKQEDELVTMKHQFHTHLQDSPYPVPDHHNDYTSEDGVVDLMGELSDVPELSDDKEDGMSGEEGPCNTRKNLANYENDDAIPEFFVLSTQLEEVLLESLDSEIPPSADSIQTSQRDEILPAALKSHTLQSAESRNSPITLDISAIKEVVDPPPDVHHNPTTDSSIFPENPAEDVGRFCCAISDSECSEDQTSSIRRPWSRRRTRTVITNSSDGWSSPFRNAKDVADIPESPVRSRAEVKRLERCASFIEAAFDALLQHPATNLEVSFAGRVWKCPNKRKPHLRNKSWLARKQKEICARGGRKAQYGKILSKENLKERKRLGWEPNQNKAASDSDPDKVWGFHEMAPAVRKGELVMADTRKDAYGRKKRAKARKYWTLESI